MALLPSPSCLPSTQARKARRRRWSAPPPPYLSSCFSATMKQAAWVEYIESGRGISSQYAIPNWPLLTWLGWKQAEDSRSSKGKVERWERCSEITAYPHRLAILVDSLNSQIGQSWQQQWQGAWANVRQQEGTFWGRKCMMAVAVGMQKFKQLTHLSYPVPDYAHCWNLAGVSVCWTTQVIGRVWATSPHQLLLCCKHPYPIVFGVFFINDIVALVQGSVHYVLAPQTQVSENLRRTWNKKENRNLLFRMGHVKYNADIHSSPKEHLPTNMSYLLLCH